MAVVSRRYDNVQEPVENRASLWEKVLSLVQVEIVRDRFPLRFGFSIFWRHQVLSIRFELEVLESESQAGAHDEGYQEERVGVFGDVAAMFVEVASDGTLDAICLTDAGFWIFTIFTRVAYRHF